MDEQDKEPTTRTGAGVANQSSLVISSENTKKIARGMSDEERYQILQGKTLSLSATADNSKLDAAYKTLFADEGNINLDGISYSARRKLIMKLAREFGVVKDYFNSDIELDFTYSGTNVEESFAKQKRNFNAFAKMLTCLDAVVENAVGIEVHNRNEIKYKEDNTLKNVYVLVSAFEDTDVVTPVKLEIKEFSDKQNTLYVAIALESIENYKTKKIGSSRTRTSIKDGVAQFPRLSSTISIVDFLKNVNPQDTNFTKYFPKQILTEEQKEELLKMNGTNFHAMPQELLNDDVMTDNAVITAAREKARELVRTTGEPYVTIEWSENAAFDTGDVLSLYEADKKLRELDAAHVGEGYDKVKLDIDYIKDGKADSYEACRFDIGDEGMGLVDHIQTFWSFYLENKNWQARLSNQYTAETVKAMNDDYANMANVVAPFLKEHIRMSEVEEKSREIGIIGKQGEEFAAYVAAQRKALNGGAVEHFAALPQAVEGNMAALYKDIEASLAPAQPAQRSQRDVVKEVRDNMVQTIIDHIRNNPTTWQKGWTNAGQAQNGKSGKEYRGINALYLSFIAAKKGYTDPRWVTYNQAVAMGAQVKKGEKASPVLFWELYDAKTKKAYDRRTTKDMTEEEREAYERENVRPIMKYSTVFNASQCANFPELDKSHYTMSEEERARQNEMIETIISNSAAPVLYDGGSHAYYAPGEDKIHLPPIEAFDSMQDYYATALHEIAHSTGAESRLNRDLSGGHDSYAIEELRAEMASVFMQLEHGIKIDGKHIENHAAYLDAWLKQVNDDVKIFYSAIRDAEKIADYVADNYLASHVDELTEEEIATDVAEQEGDHKEELVEFSMAQVSIYTKEGEQYDALFNDAGEIYLGKRSNYNNKGIYDNSDNSLLFISSNERIFDLLCRDDLEEKRQELMDSGEMAASDFEEFETIKQTTLAGFEVETDHKDKAPIFSREIPFAEQVDAVLDGTIETDSHVQVMANTPYLLRQVGLDNLPIVMRIGKLKSIMRQSGDANDHSHNLSPEMVKKLPYQIESPTMILDSKTHPDTSVVVVTEILDKLERPVIIALELNAQTQKGHNMIEANLLSTAFGKRDFQNFLQNNIDNILYWDKQKTQEMSVSSGLQLPSTMTNLESNTIIRKASAVVNTSAKNFSEEQKDEEKKPQRSISEELQQRSSIWLKINLPESCIGNTYGDKTMIKMPEGSEYGHYALYVQSKYVHEVKGKKQLIVGSDFKYRLNNDGKQVELTGTELQDSFAGVQIGKQYTRVAASRHTLQTLANIEKNIPQEMKDIPTWCCYRTKWNAEKGKKEKFIISPKDSKWASSKEIDRWVTFDEALKYARANNCEGLSLLLTKERGITCIDLDKCITDKATGEMKERATKLVAELQGTYIERSTSGNGVHIFVKDDILRNGTYRSTATDEKKGDLEVFDDRRIISVTGDMISKTNNLTRASSAATVYLRQELGEHHNQTTSTGARKSAVQGVSDGELIKRISASKKGTLFENLMSGKGDTGNRSQDDAKLAHLLLFFNGGDKEQAFRIMRNSGANRPDKPDSYYHGTIDKMNGMITAYVSRPNAASNAQGKGKGVGRNDKGGAGA